MRDFLIDTCIWSYWYNPHRYPKEHASIEGRIGKLAASRHLGVSVITWGEIAYGLKTISESERTTHAEILRFIKDQRPWTVRLNTHVAEKYGELRALLFEKYAPPNKKKKGLRPEQLVDPVTSLTLGIQENDLWIVAQVIFFSLTLVTHDKMNRIRDVAGDLHIEDWGTAS